MIRRAWRWWIVAGVVSMVQAVVLGGTHAYAQQKDGQQVVELPLSAGARITVDPSEMNYHIFRAQTAAGKAASLNGPLPLSSRLAASSQAQVAGGAIPDVAVSRTPKFYPADLSYFGGAVVQSAVFTNAFFNCSGESCWGDPIGFENNLVISRFIHLVDQYVGSTRANRYSVAPMALNPVSSYCTSPTFCSASDILNIVHAAASLTSSGYGNIINVFLPEGTDTCADAANTECYSPDDPSTFVFCAYHGSYNFPDIGETLFTVEPYQDVAGCAVAPPTPNGQEADSTDSTLSHELFETITDPDPGSGWVAASSLDEDGYEIGDECQPIGNSSGEFLAPTFPIGRGARAPYYEVQLEYSNRHHDCSSVPFH